MPWLALPFSDENTRKKLNQAFQVDGISCLVFLDKEGKAITTEGVEIIEEYGAEGYPFTAERIDELRAREEALRAAQTVESLLLSDERDFVLGNGGRKVSSCPLCLCFTLPRNLDMVSFYGLCECLQILIHFHYAYFFL